MKKIAFVLFMTFLLFMGVISLACTSNKNDEVLYLLHHSGYLYEAIRKDGDRTVGSIHIEWTGSGCRLNDKIDLKLGDEAVIEDSCIPPTEYMVYLGKEGSQLPSDMTAVIQLAEKVKDTQNQLGTINAYRAARDREKEIALFQQAIDQAGLNLSAEKWYDFFIEATWYNGDLSITIVEVRVKQFRDPDLVEIIITDSEGFELNLDGFKDDSMFGAGYRGELYYGPLE